jgi:multisubunit Na+/H+ antiporter MnhG subunit
MYGNNDLFASLPTWVIVVVGAFATATASIGIFTFVKKRNHAVYRNVALSMAAVCLLGSVIALALALSVR